MISELFLDTETDVRYVIRELKATGLNRADITAIMQAEVAPVVGRNLLSVAGEWQAFDLTPIEQRYLSGAARPTLEGQLFQWIIREEWQAILDGLETE